MLNLEKVGVRITQRVSPPRYFTWSHNIDGALRNGSYCRQDGEKVVQYMNGDYMGERAGVPDGMVEVEATKAKGLLPKCCK